MAAYRVRNIDVRFIAATNRDIRHEIQQGRFRADLFYRLNTCHVALPPLRARRQDILPLAAHFIRIHATRMGKTIHNPAPDLEARLGRYDFPGNVRELQNMIAAAVLVEESDQLRLASVGPALPDVANAANEDQVPLLPLAEIERQHIQRVLQATRGDRAQAAEILGINLSTVYRKIKRLGL